MPRGGIRCVPRRPVALVRRRTFVPGACRVDVGRRRRGPQGGDPMSAPIAGPRAAGVEVAECPASHANIVREQP